VVEAQNGKMGLAKLAAATPALILLDLMMRRWMGLNLWTRCGGLAMESAYR